MSGAAPSQVRYLPAGDQGIVVEFGSVIDPAVNRAVHNLALLIQQSGLKGVRELVPTYRSLLVHYDPLAASYEETKRVLQGLAGALGSADLPKSRVVEIPVVYGGEHGPDLGFVCQHTGLSAREVVRLHTGASYLVYALGFTPGFPYLGGMDPRLATPRLETPRTRVPAGSVGVAGSQTGVYPVESPGGWRIIGRTPVRLFEVNADPPALLEPGSYIRFVAVNQATYDRIARRVAGGTYKLRVAPYQP